MQEKYNQDYIKYGFACRAVKTKEAFRAWTKPGEKNCFKVQVHVQVNPWLYLSLGTKCILKGDQRLDPDWKKIATSLFRFQLQSQSFHG